MGRVRADVTYRIERVSSASTTDDTDHTIIRNYRLSKKAAEGLNRILGKLVTDDLLLSLSSSVGHARWVAATSCATVPVRDLKAATRQLERIKLAADLVTRSLDGDSLATWRLQSVLEDHRLGREWTDQLRASLARLGTAATESIATMGVFTLTAESNEAGELQLKNSGHVLSREGGRPSENERGVLALSVALAFGRAGIKLSKTRNGRFERSLRVLLEEAGLFVPTDLHRTVFRAVDHARWIETNLHSRGVLRTREP